MKPYGLGTSLVWRHPWLPDIIKAIISDKNPEGTLTNSYLDLSALVLHEATLLDTCPEATMATPRSVLDNMPAVSWSTRETSTINPMVAYLLRICTLYSCQFFLFPLVFYHPGPEIAWQMMHLAYLIYLTHHFLPSCSSPIRSRKFRGNSAPCCHNCFHA